MITQKTTYISIPMGLPSVAVKNTATLKAYAVFYQLKSLYVGGIILDYRRKTKEISSYFGYSERKLRTYITSLKAMNLVEVVNTKDLRLAGSKFLAQEWNASTKNYWRIGSVHLQEIENVFRSLALQENIEQQAYLLKKKLIGEAISASVSILNPTLTLQPARLKRLRKAVVCDYEKLLEETQSRCAREISGLIKKTSELSAFPWATLSRQAIATVLNRKSKATGQKYAKRFAKLGFITDERHTIFIGNFSYAEYIELQETVLDHDYSYRFFQDRVVKVMPNNISLNKEFLLVN